MNKVFLLECFSLLFNLRQRFFRKQYGEYWPNNETFCPINVFNIATTVLYRKNITLYLIASFEAYQEKIFHANRVEENVKVYC